MMTVLMEIDGEIMIDTISAVKYINDEEMLVMQSFDASSVYKAHMEYHKANILVEKLFEEQKIDLRSYRVKQIIYNIDD